MEQLEESYSRRHIEMNLKASQVTGIQAIKQNANTISQSFETQNQNDDLETSVLEEISTSCFNTNGTAQDHGIPRKRGGFMIMSVTDNESTDEYNGDESIDGDESLDDLDELQIDSKVSFARSLYKSSQNDHVFPLNSDECSPFHNGGNFNGPSYHHYSEDIQFENGRMNFSSAALPQISGGIQHEGDCKASINFDQLPNLPHNPIDAAHIGNASLPYHHDPSSTHQIFFPYNTQEILHSSAPSSIPTSNTAVTARTSVSTSSATPSKTVASRVYKVVKRESIYPVKREVSRWTCYDFSDVQTPNLSFCGHTTSDSRSSSINESYFNQTAFNFSMSTTGLPVYTNSYSFHSSDGFMTPYRADNSAFSLSATSNCLSNGDYGVSTAPYCNSSSSSSLNRDAERHKIYKSLKPIFEASESSKRRCVTSEDSRVSEASSSDQDAPRLAARHSDTTGYPELEDESAISSNTRIDQKVEAAMDLVKKHLMLAVRDEVDELKERIQELQLENETMKNLLTSDQVARLHNNLQKAYNCGSKPSYHNQLSYCQASNISKQTSPPFSGATRSLSYQHTNHVGQPLSYNNMPPSQFSNNSANNLRTSTVFSHHQSGTHAPKMATQPLPTTVPYHQGFYQQQNHERTQPFAPTSSNRVYSQVHLHNNVSVAQHYSSPQMPNPSSIISPTGPTIPYVTNLPQPPISHHPPMT